MANHQLHPLQTNPRSGELFLRLKNHPNIIITPPRWTDAACFPPLMNDERIHRWLAAPPFPYLPEHAEQWIKIVKTQSDALLQELEEARTTVALRIVDDSPVRFLREVKEDGTDVFIGDISFARCKNGELMATGGVDWNQKDKLEEENNRREPGDSNIVWTIGDFLAPSHHGKGIMTDAVGTLLHAWAIPRMGVRRILVNTFIGNEGSAKVFLKNGFTLTQTLPEHYQVKGKVEGLLVLEWKMT